MRKWKDGEKYSENSGKILSRDFQEIVIKWHFYVVVENILESFLGNFRGNFKAIQF